MLELQPVYKTTGVMEDTTKGRGGGYFLCSVKASWFKNSIERTEHPISMAITSLCITLAVLSIKPNRSQFFQYDSFAISCAADSSGWTVKMNTSAHVDQECHRSGGVPGESLCVIETAYPSDTGVYWCEHERGRSSNTVSITVTHTGVILESPPHPLMDGDNVTLGCFYKTETHHTPTSDFTANFYKNGVLLRSGEAGRMTLTGVSRSDEGLYRCEHPDGGESEESWLTVTDSAQCGAAAPPLMSRTKLVISSLLFVFYSVLLVLFLHKYRLWTRAQKDAERWRRRRLKVET